MNKFGKTPKQTKSYDLTDMRPDAKKINAKHKPKGGHDESQSLSPFLQLTYNKLIQIHASGASANKPQTDALTENQIDSELTWVAEEIKCFRQEQQALSGIKNILQSCKVSLPHEEAKKQQSSGSKHNKAGKPPTPKKTKDKNEDDDVTVINTEITRIIDEVKTLQADVKIYRQTSESILEIKDLLKNRFKSKEEGSKDAKSKRPMQTDPQTKSTDIKVDDHVNNIREIKTEISQIINELSILEKDMQSLLSLAQQGGFESQNDKGKHKKKVTEQLQGKVTAHQAFEKVQAILHGQMKTTDSATNKRQALDAVNEKQAKKENETMRNCLQKITETSMQSKNGTDIEMLTKESQSIVETLKETARLYEKQKQEKDELLKLAQEKIPDIYGEIKNKKEVKKDSSNLFPNLICEIIEMAVNLRDLGTLKKEHWTMKTFLMRFTSQDQQTSKPEINITDLVKTSDGVAHSTHDRIRLHENFRNDILRKAESAVQYTKDTNRPQQFNLENNSTDNDVIQFNSLLSKLVKSLDEEKAQFQNKMMNEIKQLKEENEGLQTRLSKVAGSRLTEGNPSITNLGDPNRPMKIAEMYSELYDNEWTDIMDKFENGKKKPKGPKVLQALYSTLVGSYQLCITKSTALEEKVKEIIQSAAKVFMINGLEEEVINQAKPLRKQHAETAAALLLKEFRLPKDQTVMKHLKVDKDMIKDILPTTFFEKCVTLCWMMIMQDPPMILQEGPKPGSTYDRNIFREYTSSGTKVEFTIWPALILNEGGPLLVKGVVSVK
ncbi:uncharacterized protein LOC143085329 [Mytilus galloprovincialis]|uniref:uncharacterized protein LOC143085329 n=1 Tax=Mytilus galloprovincialis TaxID=29158 RepID=UPI003F7C65A8